jgi:ferredoxin
MLIMNHSIGSKESDYFNPKRNEKSLVFTCRNCRRPNYEKADKCAHCGEPIKICKKV